ncbi:MAG: hypothetical protein H2060_11520 [Azoarcus sp.]|jgi:hypothetical protein|nr:hypothetical protein [Azoarcus sp.]
MRAAGSCPSCPSNLARCLLWLLVLAHLFVGTVSAASMSHVPLDDLTHAHVSDGHTHGHAHDADEPDSTGAHPAHDATDHSHDNPNVPPRHLSRGPTCATPLNAGEKRHTYPVPCSLPERPPRSLPTS